MLDELYLHGSLRGSSKERRHIVKAGLADRTAWERELCGEDSPSSIARFRHRDDDAANSLREAYARAAQRFAAVGGMRAAGVQVVVAAEVTQQAADVKAIKRQLHELASSVLELRAEIAALRAEGAHVPPPATSCLTHETLESLRKLEIETYSPNWDGEHGLAISHAHWMRVQDILTFVAEAKPALEPPFISACGDGKVHLTWTDSAGNRGLLEIGLSEMWWSSFSIDGHDDIEEAPLSRDQLLFRLESVTR